MFDQENRLGAIGRKQVSNRRALAEINTNKLLASRTLAESAPKTQYVRTCAGNLLEAQPDQRPMSRSSKSNSNPTVSRRNERERNRVKLLNLGFERLRAVVPSHSGEQLSKISTLKKAIWYIEHLDRVLHGQVKSGQEGSLDNVKQHPLHRRPTEVLTSTTRDTTLSTAVATCSKRLHQAGSIASGTASWPSPGTALGTYSTSWGRPVTQRVPSPIFPAQYGFGSSCDNISPIRKQPQEFLTSLYSASTDLKHFGLHESGYSSMNNNSVTKSYTLNSMTKREEPVPSRLSESAGNFGALFPYYIGSLYQQPTTDASSIPSLSVDMK